MVSPLAGATPTQHVTLLLSDDDDDGGNLRGGASDNPPRRRLPPALNTDLPASSASLRNQVDMVSPLTGPPRAQTRPPSRSPPVPDSTDTDAANAEASALDLHVMQANDSPAASSSPTAHVEERAHRPRSGEELQQRDQRQGGEDVPLSTALVLHKPATLSSIGVQTSLPPLSAEDVVVPESGLALAADSTAAVSAAETAPAEVSPSPAPTPAPATATRQRRASLTRGTGVPSVVQPTNTPALINTAEGEGARAPSDASWSVCDFPPPHIATPTAHHDLQRDLRDRQREAGEPYSHELAVRYDTLVSSSSSTGCGTGWDVYVCVYRMCVWGGGHVRLWCIVGGACTHLAAIVRCSPMR